MKTINTLPPFKRFCVTIGNLPSSYVDSMSYYECLMWLCKYLKDTVIPAVNENAEAVNELINWFNNLDVQDEIDQKLDEMVESGQLQEIISEYLNSTAVFGFDKVSDMLSATNLIDGSYARTCGKTTYNDGHGALYKIRTVDNDDVVDGENIIAMTTSNTLVAEKILESIKDPYKMILIGDSYGVHAFDDITKFYWEDMVEALGLTLNTNFFNGCVDGASFGNTGYLTSLQGYESTLDPNSITDIFIVGGFNDSVTSFTKDYILSKMEDFNDEVKSHFPNARVTIAHVGYSNPKLYTQVPSSYNVNNILKSISAYKEGANTLGWRYINGMEYCLKNYDTTYWEADGVHPSQSGQNEIAKYITEGFLNGNVCVNKESSFSGIEPTFSEAIVAHSGNFKFINTLNNDSEEVTMTQFNQNNFIRISGTYTFNGQTEVEIGTLNLPYMYGYNVKTTVSIPIVLQSGSTVLNGVAQINIRGNKMYIMPLVYDTANSGWRSNSADYIFFGDIKLNTETRYS